MAFFRNLVKTKADVLIFRAFPDGAIHLGSWMRLKQLNSRGSRFSNFPRGCSAGSSP
jgi:hypothetical protein